MPTLPPLPPLPLIDGALFIDNSGFIEGISTCTRYLQYKTLNQRIAAGEKSSLNFGSAIHLALEHRYRFWQNWPVDSTYYEQVAQIFTDFYSKHPVPADDWRTMNWAMEVIKKYNEKYAVEEFSLLADTKTGKPMVELPFALKLYDAKLKLSSSESEQNIPVFYTGRIDLPISIDNQIYVLDHKTTSQMGSQFWDEYRMSAQPRGYAWAFQELTGQKVAGYVINGIRTKEVPQYVLNGKSYTRSGKTQTAEGWWNETFQRERFVVKHDQNELTEWKNNTIDLVEEFFWHYSRGYFPMKTKWCAIYGRCPYYDVCSLAASDRSVMLQSGLYQDNTWSPLNKEEVLSQPTQSKQ